MQPPAADRILAKDLATKLGMGRTIYLTMTAAVMLNKNTLGVKKVRVQSEATIKQAGVTKSFDIS